MSNINYTDIDETYPTPGVDNDSQGFRDNFATIKGSLETAYTEISTLETNTAKLNATNDFFGNIIGNATFTATTEEVAVLGNILGPSAIDWQNGSYQTLTVAGINEGSDQEDPDGNGYITLTVGGWPGDRKLAHIRVAMKSDGQLRNVVFANSEGSLRVDSTNFPSNAYFTLNEDEDTKIVDFWTSDGGANVYLYIQGEYTLLTSQGPNNA